MSPRVNHTVLLICSYSLSIGMSKRSEKLVGKLLIIPGLERLDKSVDGVLSIERGFLLLRLFGKLSATCGRGRSFSRNDFEVLFFETVGLLEIRFLEGDPKFGENLVSIGEFLIDAFRRS